MMEDASGRRHQVPHLRGKHHRGGDIHHGEGIMGGASWRTSNHGGRMHHDS